MCPPPMVTSLGLHKVLWLHPPPATALLKAPFLPTVSLGPQKTMIKNSTLKKHSKVEPNGLQVPLLEPLCAYTCKPHFLKPLECKFSVFVVQGDAWETQLRLKIMVWKQDVFKVCFKTYFWPTKTQHKPNLDPKLAPTSLSFALLFQITFPSRFPTSFWTDFGPQIDFKIDQKSIRNFFQNQFTNKSYFSSIFNQISKTISCSSKMVDVQKSFQNLLVLYVFLDIRSCQPKQTRDMQRIEQSPKTISKKQRFFYRNVFSIIFGTDFQVRNLDILRKVLGSILASISDHVGVQNDVRTASKNHHEKRCQHEPNMSPNMTPRGLAKRPHDSASRWRRGPGFAS